MRITSNKGKDCPYKPITCQEGYCQDCQIYLDYLRYGPLVMGRIVSKTSNIKEVERER